MAARDWRRASDYADLAAADLSTLAWEFLRRNPQYRADLAGRGDLLAPAGADEVAGRWGLRFPAPPDLSAEAAGVFWRGDAAPAHVVVLGASVSGGASLRALERAAHARRAAEDGIHLRLADGLQLLAPPGVDPDAPLAAGAALDADFPVRLTALGALARQLAGARRPPPLTLYARRRTVLALRALDGRADGASYRDVARHVLQAPVEDAAAWRTANARDVAIRLCRAARAMMAGGYRGLLRRRR